MSKKSKHREFVYRNIELDEIYTKAQVQLKNISKDFSLDQIKEIFKFQFENLKTQMKNKEYITVPHLGTFGIPVWTDILEEERLLFGVKNYKGLRVKNKFFLPYDIINHNWLYYNKARSEHIRPFEPEVYRDEVPILFEKYKNNIITLDMVKASLEGDNIITNKIHKLLQSTKEEAKNWFTDKKDRDYKINHHNIDGFISYRDKKIAQNKKL